MATMTIMITMIINHQALHDRCEERTLTRTRTRTHHRQQLKVNNLHNFPIIIKSLNSMDCENIMFLVRTKKKHKTFHFRSCLKVPKSATKRPVPPPRRPSATFSAPIFIPDFTSTNLTASSATARPFMPTPLPPKDDAPSQSTSARPIIDLLNFPKHVNTSYMPSELDAIKNSIDSSSQEIHNSDDADDDDETFKFPPNIQKSFKPELINNEFPINSYQPQASGEQSSTKAPDNDSQSHNSHYNLPLELNKFPPNINSSYPSSTDEPEDHGRDNSYYPAPSGDNNDYKFTENLSPPDPSEKDLFNFPPNINSNYFAQQQALAASAANRVKADSYSPPASGIYFDAPLAPTNIDNHIETTYVAPRDLYNFPPNFNSNYLPPDTNAQQPEVPHNSYEEYLSPASGNPDQSFDNPSPILDQFLPPPDVASPSSSSSDGSVNGFDVGSTESLADSAPPAAGPTGNYLPPTPAPPPADPLPSYLPPPDMPMMPMMPAPSAPGGYQYAPPPAPEAPPAQPDFPKWQFDPHSEIIYDYDPHHHHHHHEEETTTTTVAPEPEEPRVKKYSYYYLGRKLWYVPLYFTLWFCLYVVALIIRSIGRHKVRREWNSEFFLCVLHIELPTRTRETATAAWERWKFILMDSFSRFFFSFFPIIFRSHAGRSAQPLRIEKLARLLAGGTD